MRADAGTRIRISVFLVLVVVIAVGLFWVFSRDSHYRVFALRPTWKTSFGDLTRQSDSVIRIDWGDSGHLVSSENTYRMFSLGYLPIRGEPLAPMPPLTGIEGLWLQDLSDYKASPLTFTNFINPRIPNAFQCIETIVEKATADGVFNGGAPSEALVRLTAEDYIFPGYVVRTQSEANALAAILEDRQTIDLNNNIVSDSGVFFRLSSHVAEDLAGNTANLDEIVRIQSEIPVLIERAERARGHPCDVVHVLFLDGHTGQIPFNSKFPATEEFMNTFAIRDKPN